MKKLLTNPIIRDTLKTLPIIGPIARNILDKQIDPNTGAETNAGRVNKKEAWSDFIEAAVTLAMMYYLAS